MYKETVIYGVLKEEKQRNLEMQETSLNELNSLRKGRIRERVRNGKIYYYLQYRQEGRVKDDDIGTDESEIENVKSELARRKRLEDVMKRLKIEQKQICKIVKD